jgi:hypothetical protein
VTSIAGHDVAAFLDVLAWVALIGAWSNRPEACSAIPRCQSTHETVRVGLIYLAAEQGRAEDVRALIDEANEIASAAGAAVIVRQIDEARSLL